MHEKDESQWVSSQRAEVTPETNSRVGGIVAISQEELNKKAHVRNKNIFVH